MTSTASSDLQKITDVKIIKDQKAPFSGVLVHEEMYRYLRAEEQRSVDLETELVTSGPKVQSKYNFLIPLSIGLVTGVVSASYLQKSSFVVNLCVGVVAGGLVVWSFN